MYAHALSHPSLRTRPAHPPRRARTPRRSRSRATVHHLRVVPRPRVVRQSWAREIARATLALINVAAAATLIYVLF
jgi:hypothetical protein